MQNLLMRVQIMRTLIALGAVVAMSAAIALSARADQARTSTMAATTTFTRCAGTGSRVDDLRDYVIDIVASTGAGADQRRTKLHVPAGSASSVTVVADSAVCARVYAAHVAQFYAGDTATVQTLAIVQEDSLRYFVSDVHQHAGEFGIVRIYDASNLVYLTGITW